MLATRPSSTALLIAKALVFIEGDPRVARLMRPGMASLSYALLSAESPFAARTFRRLGRLALARRVVAHIEARSVPGMILHYVVRKLQLEDVVRRALEGASPIEQLVVVGAGLDTLGLRLAAAGSLDVFELDHPATQEVKRRAIASGRVAAPPRFRLLPADLTRAGIAERLAEEPAFSFERRTLFLAEGVFMYLTLDEVARALAVLRRFPIDAASFAFTYMEPDARGRPAFQGQADAVDGWLRKKSEPFVWGLAPAAFEAYWTERGYEILANVPAAALRARYLTEPGDDARASAVGETIAWLRLRDPRHQAPT